MSEQSGDGMERNYRVYCEDCGVEGYVDTERFAAQLANFHNDVQECESADYHSQDTDTQRPDGD